MREGVCKVAPPPTSPNDNMGFPMRIHVDDELVVMRWRSMKNEHVARLMLGVAGGGTQQASPQRDFAGAAEFLAALCHREANMHVVHVCQYMSN